MYNYTKIEINNILKFVKYYYIIYYHTLMMMYSFLPYAWRMA